MSVINAPKHPLKRKINFGIKTQLRQALEKQAIYPLTFTPVLKDYLWGGRNLEAKLGRQLPPDPVAESWEISGHPSALTRINNGLFAGKTLPEMLSLLGVNLVGRRSTVTLKCGKFPVLVKLLDANQPLSVQVHPRDEDANSDGTGELDKNKMWYILDARPEATVIYGLKANITPASFRNALAAGQPESCLHHLPVKAGDAIFIPAGSIHAIMDGIILAEIQQNFDITYKLHDSNWVGTNGQPRPLDLEQTLAAVNFDQVEPGPFMPELLETKPGLRRELITTCPYFQVEKVGLEPGTPFHGCCYGQTFEIWGMMAGQGHVDWNWREPLALTAVQFTLLPAALGDFTIEVAEPSVLLRVYVPETRL